MHYLKREIQKILPKALLFGAIGGVLLIIIANLLAASAPMILLMYGLVLSVSVYILNRQRFRKDTKSSVLYGYCVFAVMTFIAYLDMAMNTDPNFVNPVFESLGFLLGLILLVPIFSGAVAILFKRSIAS